MSDALAWCAERLPEFDPFSGGRIWEVKHAQRISELAFVVWIADRLGLGRPETRARLLDFLEGVQRNPRYRDRVLRAPAEFVLYCDVYGLLAQLGRPDPEMGRRLQVAVDAGLLQFVERHPHRLMDVALSLEMAGIAADFPSVEAPVAASILASDLNPLYLREGGMYALTHVVMFLWGFGLREPAAAFASERARLAARLPALVIDAALQRHWDLLSELLILWEILELPRGGADALGWRALLSMRLPDGAFPGPDADLFQRPDPPRSAEEIAQARGRFRHCYHTTLTTAVAAALRGRPARPREEIAAPARQGDRRAVLVAAGAGRAAAWLVERAIAAPAPRPALLIAQALLGAWVASTHLGDEALLDTLVAALRAQPAMQATSGAEPGDLPLMALAGVLTSGLGLALPQLSEVTHTLLSLDRHGVDAPGWGPVQAALVKLGLQEAPPAIPPAVVEGWLEQLDLAADRRAPDRAIALAEALLCAGEALPPLLLDLLRGIVAYRLREYQLTGGALALRALVRAVPRDELVEMGIRYLCDHQRPEGAIGHLGPEQHALVDPAQGVFLSTRATVYGLIALAEAQGWRPEDALFRWATS